MEWKSRSLDHWRSYFQTANCDIFNIINHAIMVAVTDCPNEFRLRRDGIAELLFSSKMTACVGCDRVELALPGEDEDGGCKSGKSVIEREGFESGTGGSKESRINGGGDDRVELNPLSNFSFGEADVEALTDEIEEANKTLQEVLRIKDILLNSRDESETELHDCLRRLQLMALNVDLLKETEIGKAVNDLRRHASKQIRVFARSLVLAWKELVDEWVSATKTIPEGTPDSVHPDGHDDEDGLPSPPMDDAFFATPPPPIDFSQFFDGMDDYGNTRDSGESNKGPERKRKLILKKKDNMRSKQEGPVETDILAKGQQMKKQEAVQLRKSCNAEPGPGKPLKINGEQNVKNEIKLQQKSDKVSIQKRTLQNEQDKSQSLDEAAVQIKLEATKRKLQESYQLVNKAKKQRKIQVMELQDIPKQGSGHKNLHMKSGNHNRHQPNGHL